MSEIEKMPEQSAGTFPNPCPVCGADDEHGTWRKAHPNNGIGATYCPHPAERGHGTGCCCAGLPKSPFLSAFTMSEPLPPAADMRYEDEDAVARVLVRVEWKGGKIREYEAVEPQAFDMNDPEDPGAMVFQSMGMSVTAHGAFDVPPTRMMAAVPFLRLSFTPHPRRNMVIRTERTAPSGRGEDPGDDQHRTIRSSTVADDGDGEGNGLAALPQAGVDLPD